MPAGGKMDVGRCALGEKDRRDVADRDLRARRALVIGALVTVAIALAAMCLRWAPEAYAWASDPAAVRSFVAEHAILSRLAIGGANALQIALAFLPGEPVELASGYAFGFWEGTLVCMAASAVASSAIFWAVRRWGWSLVGVFFDRSHLERFSWLRDARRLELVMLVVFLIPGTPKDFLTYFAGTTGSPPRPSSWRWRLPPREGCSIAALSPSPARDLTKVTGSSVMFFMTDDPVTFVRSHAALAE